MSDTAITVEHLTKTYRLGVLGQSSIKDILVNRRTQGTNTSPDPKIFTALDDISFSMARGEVLGVVGKNGAGKSTLLKILSRITSPTSGRIEIVGRAASLLEVGTGFHPEMTGRDNIYMNGAILGMKRDEISRKFDEIVSFSEIGKFIDTPVKRYSSGMYVRLAFAVAAHLDSDILIVDEVLAVGDTRFQKKSLGKMDEASKAGGKTVLFVSHNLSAIRRLCKTSLWLEKGRVVAHGPTREVLAAYLEDGSETGEFEVHWPDGKRAPGNDVVRLNRVFLGDAQAQIPDKLTTDDEFYICIDFEQLQTCEKTGFTLNLYVAGEEQLAFSSLSNRQHDWYLQANPPGRYLATCRVPASLLNSGGYSLGINLFSEGYLHYAEYKDILSFVLQDGSYTRGDYVGPMEGIFRPALDWHTRSLPQTGVPTDG